MLIIDMQNVDMLIIDMLIVVDCRHVDYRHADYRHVDYRHVVNGKKKKLEELYVMQYIGVQNRHEY